MRIGEILVEHGWIDSTSLQRAIAEQRRAGMRLCSLLISRGILDPDHAARALGQQHGVAAVLQRHLENRDRSLVQLVPAALARSIHALPVGRMRGGELIVCVRDPKPGLHAAITQIVGGTVVLAVAPAHQLERLIDLAYEPSASDEYDVDLTTGPIQSVEAELATGPQSSRGHAQADDPGLGMMTLVELDDVGVAKDFSQAGLVPAALPGSTSRPIPVPALASTSRSMPAIKLTLEGAVEALATAPTRDAATDLAMRYALGRWSAALLLTIKEGAALGHRGHGSQLSTDAVRAVALPLSAPSLLKLAHDTRRLATEPPPGAGAIQERLSRLLARPRLPAAAPILVGSHVACVFVVGDPIDSDAAHAHDLDTLAEALGAAYARVVRDKKSPEP